MGCYRQVMRENGVKVLTVRDILSYGVEEHIGARVELENLAMQALTYDLDANYKCAPSAPSPVPSSVLKSTFGMGHYLTTLPAPTCRMEDLAEEHRFYLSDEYKRTVLEHMSLPQLLDMLLINPTVHVSPSYRDTGLTACYTFKPLSNLVYTRDQQVHSLNSQHIVSSSYQSCYLPTHLPTLLKPYYMSKLLSSLVTAANFNRL